MKFQPINWYKRTKDGYVLTVGSIPEDYPECVVYTEGRDWKVADIQTGIYWGRDAWQPTRKLLGPVIAKSYQTIHDIAKGPSFTAARDDVLKLAEKDGNQQLINHIEKLKETTT